MVGITASLAMRHLELAALALAIVPAAPADAQTYRSYTNVRFAYAVCYPSFMTAHPEAPNSDGRVFSAPDGGELTVYGSNNPEGTSLADNMRGEIDDLIGKVGKVTYRANGPNWAVFSGVKGTKLFYGKTFQRRDQFATFELAYPRGAAARYKPVAEQLSRCFRLVRGGF